MRILTILIIISVQILITSCDVQENADRRQKIRNAYQGYINCDDCTISEFPILINSGDELFNSVDIKFSFDSLTNAELIKFQNNTKERYMKYVEGQKVNYANTNETVPTLKLDRYIDINTEKFIAIRKKNIEELMDSLKQTNTNALDIYDYIQSK